MSEARGERVIEGPEGGGEPGGTGSSVPVRSAVYNRGKWTRRNDSPEISDFLVSEDEFEKGRMIGCGSFTTCYLGVQKETGLKVAMAFYRDIPSIDESEMMLRVVTYLGRFAHPLIVPLIGFGIAPSSFLVTKFMPNGALESMLRERGSKPPKGWDATAKSKCVFGIAAGMAFLHSKNIIHRDLKPINILLDDDFEPVIGGLECATEYIVGAKMEEGVGTPLFMAPEVVIGEECYNHKVDVYSFAVVLYRLFTDSMVFDDGSVAGRPTLFHFYRMVGQGRRFKRVDNIPDFYWDLICKCWSQDPIDRPSFVEIVKHLRAHTSEYAFEGSDLSLLREYEMHALESISDIL